jgi:succinate dehydrogenase / fumarate reductase cytochrome b subunit
VIFLSFHILDTAFVYFAPWLYEDILELFRSTLFGLGEILLVFCVFYHGVNGLRIAIFDLFIPKYWQINSERISVRVILGITFLIWIPAAAIMTRSLLIHNFGMFGG